MPAMEEFQSSTIICRGGLNSNRNWLFLNQTNPGYASSLVNFEPSLFGGYRRINGYAQLESTDSGEVAPLTAEGKIFGLGIHSNDEIIAARKLQAGTTYSFFKYVSGSAWTNYSHGLTLTSTGVDKVRSHEYNFDGTNGTIFVDGVNVATLYNGTSWIDVGTGDTGANFANAGGAQALAAPSLVHAWENHLFVSGCSAEPNIVAHSAPNAEYDWTSVSGAGQINAGMVVRQIYPFRDKLFVFGDERIRYIYVDVSGSFAIEDVTSDMGIRGADTVVEVGGDLLFLGPDGIRPISATARIGDFELASVSKMIQQDLKDLSDIASTNEIHSVIIRGKSQFRYFYSDTSTDDADSVGIIGGLKQYNEGLSWEFGRTLGIKVSCATSGYYGGNLDEYVIHGSHDGFVFRQEQGNSLNGGNIYAEYGTPYLDFGMPSIRKTPHQISIFARPEGEVSITTSVIYDWGISNRTNPSSYTTATEGDNAVYGEALYGTGTYDGVTVPTMVTNVQGSGHSFKMTFSTDDTSPPYSIQGLVILYKDNGYK